MRLKLYRAGGMTEAMARVRAELGPEAVILSSRRVGGEVELTAALEPEHEPAAPLRPRRAAARATGATLKEAQGQTGERSEHLRYHSVPADLHHPLLRGPLPQALGRTLRFGDLPTDRRGPPLLFAGPPGAGKTLTIARLATRLVLRGIAPMVITTDGYRAAAAEQLAAFTRLLGLSLVVAHNPASLARAIRRRPEGAPVLVDSTGCDAFSAHEREAVAALADAAGANVVAVLAGGLDATEAAEHAAGLAEAGARYLIATKLDLTRRVGAVLAAAHAGGLRLTDAGVGPGAADGLAPLTPDYLAARLTSSGARPC